MATPPQKVILTAVMDLLETIDGTGDWSYDLTGRVLRGPLYGSSGLDASAPVLGVYAPGQSGVVSTTRTQKSTLELHIEGWVPQGADFGATEDAVWQLQYDVGRALTIGTGLRGAVIAAATALGVSAPAGYNAAITQIPSPRVHGDAETGDALLHLHLVYRVDFDLRLDGSA